MTLASRDAAQPMPSKLRSAILAASWSTAILARARAYSSTGCSTGRAPPGYSNQPRSHNAVAAAVAQRRADWGIAIESVARLYGLAFLPIAPEDYDFLVVESRRERAGPAAFLEALRDETVREKIRALGMHPAEA
jgi:molybdate-binding protein